MKYSNMKILLKISLMILFSSSIFLTYSCKKTAEHRAKKMIERATGDKVDVDLKDEKVVMTTEDGTFSADGSATTWPKGVYSEVPKFTFGNVTNTLEQENDKGKSWMIGFENVSNRAIARYKKELLAKGFKIEMTTMVGEDGNMMATKGDIMVHLMVGGDAANLSIGKE